MIRSRPLLAASAVLLAACPMAGMHTPAADLVLAVRPEAAAPGDTLRLTATLANPGRDTLQLAFDVDCVVKFYVRAEPDGALLEPAGGMYDCPLRQQTVSLAPGAARRFEHAWAVPSAVSDSVTAYFILEEHHVVDGGDRDFKAAHRSNEVTVRVRRAGG